MVQQFEQEKENEVKDELGEKVKMPSVVRGWDSWAGDGVDETKYQQKVKQLQKVKQ